MGAILSQEDMTDGRCKTRLLVGQNPPSPNLPPSISSSLKRFRYRNVEQVVSSSGHLVLPNTHTLQLPRWAGTLSPSSVLTCFNSYGYENKPPRGHKTFTNSFQAKSEQFSPHLWPPGLSISEQDHTYGQQPQSLRPWLCRTRTEVSI